DDEWRHCTPVAVAGLPTSSLPARRIPGWLGHVRRLHADQSLVRWATGCNARALAERAILPCQKASSPERAFWRRFAKTNATEATPMDIIPLRPGFGAELRGVTLADVAAHDAAY